MKNKQSGFGMAEALIVVITAGLIVAMGYLAYVHMIKINEPAPSEGMFATKAMPPLIGGVAGRNVSRPDAYMEAPGLLDALKKIAENNPCQPTEGRFKQIVLGVTSDKTQALIGNSCGSTGVRRTFMVLKDGTWSSVGAWKDSQQGDFSLLTDTPSCEMTEKYGIQASIAPICFELREEPTGLLAGDMSNYSYRVR